MAKKKSIFSSLVYSTDPLFIREEIKEEAAILSPGEQKLKVFLDKKQRAGKVVTLLTGFQGKEEDMMQLSKDLKSFCGTGGSVKNGVIIIQGDNKEKIFQKLLQQGYKQIKKL